MSTRLLLARAGSSDYDEQQRIAGTLDVPLSCRGRAEADDLARDLSGEPVEAVYATAGDAATETARVLADGFDVRLRVLEELTNQDFGLWQGLCLEDVKRKHPKLFRQWEETPCAVCPPRGEGATQVAERVRRELRPLLRRHEGDTVVLVAPDPLRAIIRCTLLKTAMVCPWTGQGGRQADWEALLVPTNRGVLAAAAVRAG